jgi:hypothetical protein
MVKKGTGGDSLRFILRERYSSASQDEDIHMAVEVC